jgi:hypothetical protein
MLLTDKLLKYIHRVFDKESQSFLALRLRYPAGTLTWEVSDGVLSTAVSGGIGAALSVDLSDYTVSELVEYLASQPGYEVPYSNTGSNSSLSARVLVDGSGDQDSSNGDHLYGYTSLLWAYLESFSVELSEASTQIDNAITQMNSREAEGDWLDEWAGYYGVDRETGEEDADFANRIIVEVIRPRGNNVAMADAIGEVLGQSVTVTDVTLWGETFPLHNSAITHDGTEEHDASALPVYGMFDVDYSYDLLSGKDMTEYVAVVKALVDRMRDAGTHLRALSLKASSISDTASAPVDQGALAFVGAMLQEDSASGPSGDEIVAGAAIAAMSDAVGEVSESASVSVSYSTAYSGMRTHNAKAVHSGGYLITESLP